MVSVDTYDNLSRDCSPAFLIIGYVDTELLSAHEHGVESLTGHYQENCNDVTSASLWVNGVPQLLELTIGSSKKW